MDADDVGPPFTDGDGPGPTIWAPEAAWLTEGPALTDAPPPTVFRFQHVLHGRGFVIGLARSLARLEAAGGGVAPDWRRVWGQANELHWWWQDTTHLSFWECDPAWTRYWDPETDQRWWRHGETGTWFWVGAGDKGGHAHRACARDFVGANPAPAAGPPVVRPRPQLAEVIPPMPSRLPPRTGPVVPKVAPVAAGPGAAAAPPT